MSEFSCVFQSKYENHPGGYAPVNNFAEFHANTLTYLHKCGEKKEKYKNVISTQINVRGFK